MEPTHTSLSASAPARRRHLRRLVAVLALTSTVVPLAGTAIAEAATPPPVDQHPRAFAGGDDDDEEDRRPVQRPQSGGGGDASVSGSPDFTG